MPYQLATHPLIAHKMTTLRDRKTSAKDFRSLLREITFLLGFEATRDLKLGNKSITTPMDASFEGFRVAEKIAIVPILRAGLSMADGMLELMPKAAVHHIGMFRTKQSLLPVQYYNRLPKEGSCDVAYVVDPCIATANTVNAVVSILKKWGAPKIVIVAAIASNEGLERLGEQHPDVQIFVGAIDNVLSDKGMIVPGIGDAGDRQFGTSEDVVPEVGAKTMSPIAKRKRDDDDA